MMGFGHMLPPSSSQLLTLKTLDIAQINRAQTFGDIDITRTVRGSKRVAPHACNDAALPPSACRRSLQRP